MKNKNMRKKLLRKTKITVSAMTLIFTISLLTACSKPESAGMIIAGSTSVQPYAEVLAEEYMIDNPDSPIDIQGGGSSAGITAAQTESAQIGMSSRSLHEDELDLWQVEIAMDGLVLIVNPNNPIEGLRLDQIRDIYSGKITKWSQVGGEDSEIH